MTKAESCIHTLVPRRTIQSPCTLPAGSFAVNPPQCPALWQVLICFLSRGILKKVKSVSSASKVKCRSRPLAHSVHTLPQDISIAHSSPRNVPPSSPRANCSPPQVTALVVPSWGGRVFSASLAKKVPSFPPGALLQNTHKVQSCMCVLVCLLCLP